MANRIPKSNGASATKESPATFDTGKLYDEAATKFEARIANVNEMKGGNAPVDTRLQTADAFRHTYAGAVVTLDIANKLNEANPGNTKAGQKIAFAYAEAATETLGRGLEHMSLAHMGRNNNNQADIGMDLHNNSKGIEIAKQLGMNATREQVADAIVKEMNQGNLILNNKDPRAQAHFNNQPDMVAAQAGRDGAAIAYNTVKDAASTALDKGRDFAASAMDKGKEVFAKINAQNSHTEVAQGKVTLDQSAQARATPKDRDLDTALDKSAPSIASSSSSSSASRTNQSEHGQSAESVKKAGAQRQQQAEMTMGE